MSCVGHWQKCWGGHWTRRSSYSFSKLSHIWRSQQYFQLGTKDICWAQNKALVMFNILEENIDKSTYLYIWRHRPFHRFHYSTTDKKIKEVLFSSDNSKSSLTMMWWWWEHAQVFSVSGPTTCWHSIPNQRDIDGISKNIALPIYLFLKKLWRGKKMMMNNDEKKPWGTTTHPHSRRSKERATKGLFLQPLWRRIYCRSQTEKRQNDPFCTFCSLQMATQVVWKCIPRQCKYKKCLFLPLKCKKKYFWLFSSFWSASISTQQQESEDISVFFSACHRQKPLHLGKASEKCN